MSLHNAADYASNPDMAEVLQQHLPPLAASLATKPPLSDELPITLQTVHRLFEADPDRLMKLAAAYPKEFDELVLDGMVNAKMWIWFVVCSMGRISARAVYELMNSGHMDTAMFLRATVDAPYTVAAQDSLERLPEPGYSRIIQWFRGVHALKKEDNRLWDIKTGQFVQDE